MAGPALRRGAKLLLAALLLTPTLLLADFAEHYRAAIAAYRAGDSQAFLQAAQSARNLRPDSLFFEPASEPAFTSLQLADTQPMLLQRLAANGAPHGEVSTTFTLEEDRFIPEGIARDEERRRFLLGSIHQRRILAIGDDGQVSEFAAAGQGGLLSVFGMEAVPRTSSLWVATAGLRESGDMAVESIGRSGVLEFDLATGEPRRAFWLPEDGREHLLGELLFVEGGVLLSTDSLTGELLRLDTRSGQFETLVESGRLVSPQGLALSEDLRSVFVADYRGGVFRVGLEDGALVKLAEGGTTHHGIDGLYRHHNWLIAVQNGVRPHRVVALRLEPGGEAVGDFEVLAAARPEFDEPTLGVIVDGRLHFVANSHWPRFDPDGQLPDGLTGPLVMSVTLP
jgi:sugar lactone lactonase YvrE